MKEEKWRKEKRVEIKEQVAGYRRNKGGRKGEDKIGKIIREGKVTYEGETQHGRDK